MCINVVSQIPNYLVAGSGWEDKGGEIGVSVWISRMKVLHEKNYIFFERESTM